MPIELVPLGARVPTKNPKPWEYDDSLPEPHEASWAKISITVKRNDGGVVDAELLRPRSWVKANDVQVGPLLRLNLPELEIAGLATVNSIAPCPVIATGEGSVITGRFATHRVDVIARIEFLGADDIVDALEGTIIHPIWSVDRNNWVPLGELEVGEYLLCESGRAVVLSIAILQHSVPVYNIEVHGEHVYQVGSMGNLSEDCFIWAMKHADEIGGEIRHLKPTLSNPYKTIGFLPDDNPQFGAYAYHTFIEKGGKLYDEIFENGVEMVHWIDEFKGLNKLTDDMFEIWYTIDGIPHSGVWK
ncbi:MAG: polymorphic toxin-type HINT domain-containing protein [Aureliella sp.]